MRAKVSTYSWRATAAAALLSIGTFIWFWTTYDFVNPDGSPDNTLIHNLPGFAQAACVLWITALLAFRILGLVQRRRQRPSFWLGMAFALALSLALSGYVYYAVALATPDPVPGAAMSSAILLGFSWISLAIGASTQFCCMRAAKSSAAPRSPSTPSEGA